MISDKVQRTINEKADSAIYAIKAKVNISNTDIYANDIFLSASTESTVCIRNSSLRDLTATGKVFHAVSSIIELISVTISRIKYNRTVSTGAPNFYKITIVNKSFLRASNCTFDSIDGLFLYISGSTLIMDNYTSIINTKNDDREAALMSIDTSTVTINQTAFLNIKSDYFSPLINIQETQLDSSRV